MACCLPLPTRAHTAQPHAVPIPVPVPVPSFPIALVPRDAKPATLWREPLSARRATSTRKRLLLLACPVCTRLSSRDAHHITPRLLKRRRAAAVASIARTTLLPCSTLQLSRSHSLALGTRRDGTGRDWTHTYRWLLEAHCLCSMPYGLRRECERVDADWRWRALFSYTRLINEQSRQSQYVDAQRRLLPCNTRTWHFRSETARLEQQ